MYDPGTQYAEFVKRLPNSLVSHREPSQLPFIFEPYSKGTNKLLDQERKSTDSVESEDSFRGKLYNLKTELSVCLCTAIEFMCFNDNFLGQTDMVCAVQPVQIFLAHHSSCIGEFSHKTLHNHQF